MLIRMADGGTSDGSGPSAEEVAGSLAARRALGPDAEDAVIEAFLERTGQAIDKRVDARLQQVPPPPPLPNMPLPHTDHTPFVLAIVSLGAGIPLTGIATQFKGAGLVAVAMVWIGIAMINLIYNRYRR
ncbi:hypothetical protein GCM10022220_32870 [Actinocatenispora rupis]|uniref:Uncharacterized protein n=2 Tax=Actinocatenispora rupis TaxID=519421 RepID=A0A8J3J6D7_9ACTN|nr:hypothetical protein Aru02nite_36860 [Actinocatenispora rupis]